jgi:hypothetical protein
MIDKTRRYLLLIIGNIICSFGILIYFQINFQTWADNQNERIQNNGKIQIFIRDNYTGIHNKLDIYEFFNEKDSLHRLQNVYDNLVKNSYFKYVEIINQSFDYKGLNDFDNKFIINERNESANQLFEEEYITPLKSLQISNQVYDDCRLIEKIILGEGFTKSDFYIDDRMKIKVILGSGYMDLFNIGDIFHVKYLAYGDLNCEVIGFLKAGTQLTYQAKPITLDNYIVAPAIN